MKKVIIVLLLLLFSTISVSGEEFKDTLKKAKIGNVEAQFTLGELYIEGKTIPKNYVKAFYWFEKAASQGDADAQNNLAYFYEKGLGVKQNYKKSNYWAIKAAENGNFNAQKALWERYYVGKFIEQNYQKAVYWLKKVAKMNDQEAQYNLGVLYFEGDKVLQDYKKALYWLNKSAEQGHTSAQYNLGLMYTKGIGIPQNFIKGYVYHSLAAANGHKKAKFNRDDAAEKLSHHQLIVAQEFAAKLQYNIDNPNESYEQQPSVPNSERKIIGSGTGFFITKNGYILTCHHVVENANEIKIVFKEIQYPAKLIRDDSSNDLALLKIDGSFPAIAFSSKKSAKMGQEVFTIGFPNPSLQGVSAKFTKGTISSLTGFQDDLRLYQISVPVQPGNSGGALVNENGNILGVIVAKLNAQTTFKISGSLPQNVNYAIKSIYAQAMLDSLPELYNKLIKPSKNKSDAIDRVRKSTVMVLSYE